jgi:nitroreductase
MTAQERYIAHQGRKAEVLMGIMRDRHSSRVFSEKKVEEETVSLLREMVILAPSSCDRKAIVLTRINQRDDKALLGGLLVGGVGWIHRAPEIFLLKADRDAYKAQGEVQYMPYLDAGVVIQQLYLAATALDLHCCFVNPNIRERNLEHFEKVFGDGIFCGAFCFGLPERRP